MSVISLVWKRDSDRPLDSLLRIMLSRLVPFGRSRQRMWNAGRIAFGGNFSDSLPEDRFDAQPLWNSDRSACLIADVRLDNRAELLNRLEIPNGAEVADSALLMAAWLRWGRACVDYILGAFAFAVWLPGAQEIFAARDHTGERPLFYHYGKGLFALASLPKGLLALPGVPRNLNESGIADWLVNTVADPAPSLFRAVERVPPGHFVR